MPTRISADVGKHPSGWSVYTSHQLLLNYFVQGELLWKLISYTLQHTHGVK